MVRGVAASVWRRGATPNGLLGQAAATLPLPCRTAQSFPRSHSSVPGFDKAPPADTEQLLSRYSTFTLNDKATPLGPQPGDEAVLTLSGGVDSSVAAYLAVAKGGLVPARTIFMRNWNSLDEKAGFEPGAGGSSGCDWMRDWELAQRMASWLGVKAELLDLSAEYWNSVFTPSLEVWSAGLTPNPDVLCNTKIKFGELLRRLDTEGTLTSSANDVSYGRRQSRRWLVTGHYADIEYYLPRDGAEGSPQLVRGRLRRAVDDSKDQSYFLSGVDALHLGRAHFPLAQTPKTDVRKIAQSMGMPTAASRESMGLCFVGERKGDADQECSPPPRQLAGRTAQNNGFAGFLGTYIEPRPGAIVTSSGEQVGSHNGLHTLTIGQRARVGGIHVKHYVAAKDAASNKVLIVPGRDHPWLQCKSLQVDDFHIIGEADVEGRLLDGSSSLLAKTNYNSAIASCTAELARADPADKNGRGGSPLRVTMTGRMDSVAEGQVCAVYADRQCLGSGVITSVETFAPRHQSWTTAPEPSPIGSVLDEKAGASQAGAVVDNKTTSSTGGLWASSG